MLAGMNKTKTTTVAKKIGSTTNTVLKESWDKPVPESATPKITEARYRRYFENKLSLTAPAATKTMIYTRIFEYPAILRELQIDIQTAGNLSNDIVRIAVDEFNIFNDVTEAIEFSQPEIIFGETVPTTGTIDPATGVLTTVSSDFTDEGNNTPWSHKEVFKTLYYSTKIDIEALMKMTLDTYVVRKLEIEINNVQAAQDDTINLWLISDIPVEAKYSAAQSGYKSF